LLDGQAFNDLARLRYKISGHQTARERRRPRQRPVMVVAAAERHCNPAFLHTHITTVLLSSALIRRDTRLMPPPVGLSFTSQPTEASQWPLPGERAKF